MNDGTPNPNVSFHGVTLLDFLKEKYNEYVDKRRAIWAEPGELFRFKHEIPQTPTGSSTDWGWWGKADMMRAGMKPKLRKLQDLDNEYLLDQWRSKCK